MTGTGIVAEANFARAMANAKRNYARKANRAIAKAAAGKPPLWSDYKYEIGPACEALDRAEAAALAAYQTAVACGEGARPLLLPRTILTRMKAGTSHLRICRG